MTPLACKDVLLALLLGSLLSQPDPALALGQPLNPSPGERQALERARGKLPGQIVFASRRDGKWRLYAVAADGGGLRRLSNLPANERRPYFAQKGNQLYFQSDRNGLTQVWRARPDLGQAQLVSPAGRAEWLHGVSEDGKRLLVRTGDRPGDYLLRFLDSGREVRLDFPGWVDAVLAPDGRGLGVLSQPRDGGQPEQGVYAMEVDDEGRLRQSRPVSDGYKERLSEGRQWEYWPAFSPDSQYIVFGASPSDQHDSDTGNYEIYVHRAQGGEPLRLTFHSAPDVEPAWGAGAPAGLKDGGYQELKLPFELGRETKDLECRVAFLPGVAELHIDRISVSPAPQGLGGYFQRLWRKALGRGD